MTQSTLVKSTFDNLGIEPRILSILKNKKFFTPTPIQRQCIPIILKGKDIVGIAQTGTGKTLAFGIPILQNLINSRGQALILVPTRELAIQADEMLYGSFASLGLKTAVIIGGAPINNQIRDLRRNPHVVIATPGRLLDHLKRGFFKTKDIKVVVLDEADRMFDIGFLPDIKRILAMSPKERQTLLFSATMPPEVAQIALHFMKMPVRVEVAPAGTAASGVEHELFIVNKERKLPLLEKVLSQNSGRALVFLRTKHATKKITRAITAMGHTAVEIHSDRSLFQRREAMAGFKSGKYKVLVATDIAARGIDVSEISIVVNYDLPQSSGDYVHRIGRTGRAGMKGRAISFATPDQRGNIRQIEGLIRKNIPITSLPKILSPINENVRAAYHKKENEKHNFRGNKYSSYKKPFRGHKKRY